MKQLDDKIKQKIIAVISALIPDAKIYLFGSRARGTNSERADIDIALDAAKRIPGREIDELRRMFGESNVPYVVEVVDLYQVTDLMREQILKDKVVWK